MNKTIYLLMFLLLLNISYAFDFTVFYTDINYSLPILALLLFFILFFLFRKKIRKLFIKEVEEPIEEYQSLIPPIRVEKPDLSPAYVTKRPGKWKREMKFTFTNFYGIPSKEHIRLKKKKGVFDRLSSLKSK